MNLYKFASTCLLILLLAFISIDANPNLTAGVWEDISPTNVTLHCCGGDFKSDGKSYGIPTVEIDPSNPSTLYACVDQQGVHKTTDGGSTWKRVGHLDSPVAVRVDPANSLRLYATQGVRGETQGFWKSNDGGISWTQPDGFKNFGATLTNQAGDVTWISVDPSDFNHVLLSYHSAWDKKGLTNSGVVETKDGGDSWVAHTPPAGFGSGTKAIHFLYSPDLGFGNSDTWLMADDGAGFWRTTTAGLYNGAPDPQAWKLVSNATIPHGGMSIYYTRPNACSGCNPSVNPDGYVLYAGAASVPRRSIDNGATWTTFGEGLPNWYYYAVGGDGVTMYTQLSYTGDNAGQGLQPYYTIPEKDSENKDTTWKKFRNGDQTFTDGPLVMTFDSKNAIMYSANWDSGLWALKVTNYTAWGTVTKTKSSTQSSDPGLVSSSASVPLTETKLKTGTQINNFSSAIVSLPSLVLVLLASIALLLQSI